MLANVQENRSLRKIFLKKITIYNSYDDIGFKHVYRVFILRKKRINRKLKICIWKAILNFGLKVRILLIMYWYCDRILVNCALSVKSMKLFGNVIQHIWSDPEVGTNYDCPFFCWKQRIVWIPKFFYSKTKFEWIEFVIIFQNVYKTIPSRTASNLLYILPCRFIEITLQIRCYPVNLQHIFQNTFS